MGLLNNMLKTGSSAYADYVQSPSTPNAPSPQGSTFLKDVTSIAQTAAAIAAII